MNDAQRQEEEVISAQEMLDKAPGKGSKSTYLSLPTGLRYFIPERGQIYKAIFLPWRAGKHNPTKAEGSWTTNLFIPVHKGIGPNNETFICSYKRYGERCPVCEEVQRLTKNQPKGEKEGKQFWKEVISPLKFKDRELYLIHIVGGPKDLVQVWDESSFLFGDDFREAMSMDNKFKLFADFNKGMIVSFKAAEHDMGSGKSCTKMKAITFSERTEPLSEALIKAAKTYCLDLMPVKTPYEKLKRIMGNTGGVDETENGNGVSEVDAESPVVSEPNPGREVEETYTEEPDPE